MDVSPPVRRSPDQAVEPAAAAAASTANAVPPKSRGLWAAALAAGLAVALASGLVATGIRRDRPLTGRSEVESALGLSVVGEVP